jgi:hypothetical protein
MQHVLSQDTAIDGNNLITLDGQNQTGIFKSDKYLHIMLQNITLSNGLTTGQGGALDLGFWSELTVRNVIFNNNVALKDSASCDGGGAIFVGGGSVALIENSQFNGNRANNGGAINNLRSGLTVVNSTFYNNRALHTDRINQFGDCGGGGALYIDATRKPEDGGPDPVVLRGNTFVDNSSNNHGGALFVAVQSNEKVTISDSTFSGNRVLISSTMPTSGTGGAIWYGRADGRAEGHYLSIYRSTFVENHAETQGGGLWTSSAASVVNTTFVGNTAINPAELDRDDWQKGNGGAIAVAHQVLVILDNTTIVANRAGFNGGGIVGENIAARNTIIANNRGDWYLGLQQNCTHALQDWGNNLQYLNWYPTPDHVHQSNCGSTVRLADPLVGELSYHGGITRLVPLLPASPAIDAGNPETCPGSDQRGVSRPQGAACDIGAFELEQ